MSLSIKDFIAGWVGGICGLLVGHPADTIKVRQQVSANSNIVKLFLTTVKHEGIRGFYRGMFFPFLLAGVQNSLFFGIYGNTLRILQKNENADINIKTCAEGSISNNHWHLNVYLAGFTAGFVHSFIVCPVDLIKIKIQAQKSSENNTHRVKECIRKIYSQSGFLGFYKGFVITLIRDVPWYGLYVLLYEHLLSFGHLKDNLRSEYSIQSQILAGGLSGTLVWISVTPLDVIKSRIQADSIRKPQYNGIMDCLFKSWNQCGFSVFGRGFWIHVLRGFPVNAATFVGYEWSLKTFTFSK